MLLAWLSVTVFTLLPSNVNTSTEIMSAPLIFSLPEVGLGYTSPMIAGWKWLPNQKGLVSGVILTGFGAGGFFFNLIGTKFVNPNGLDVVAGKFPEEGLLIIVVIC